MNHVNHDIRLTDELERQLMMKAIEEQYRFKPLVSLKKLFANVFGVSTKPAASVGQAAHHAS